MKKYTPKQCQAFLDTAKLLLNTDKSVKDIFETLTSLHKKEKACTFFDSEGKPHSYTYETYKKLAIEYASKLSTLLKEQNNGTPVGLKLANSPNWPLMFWAIIMCGYKPLLIDVRAMNDATLGLLKNAKASALICDSEIEGLTLPRFSLNDVLEAKENESFVPSWENQVYFCSSGTSGNAKMFIYDGECLCNQILAALSIPKQSVTLMHPGKINILAMIPYHHVFGFMAVFLWFNFYGKNVVYPRSISSKDLMYACQKGKCTHIFSVPMFWDNIVQAVERTIDKLSDKKKMLLHMMMDYNLGDISKKTAGQAAYPIVKDTFQKKVLGNKVEFAISGGGALNTHTEAVVNGLGYPLSDGYGMTELGVTSVEQSPATKDRLKVSIGKPFYGVFYKILDDKEVGELLVKAASMAKWKIVDGEISPMELTKDGYFHTQDVASIDKDGRCYLRGREKDIIINSDGENVYPDELESIFKGISHSANNVVLGVKDEENSSKENITLVIQLDSETKEEDLENIKGEFETLNATLPMGRRIEKAYITRKPLPLANGIKVKRFLIKKELESGKRRFYIDFNDLKERRKARKIKRADFSSYDKEAVNETLDKIKEIWAKTLILEKKDIKDDSHFSRDLGGDSMTYVTMMDDINQSFSIEIPVEIYGILVTPEQFTKYILDLKKETK